MFMEPGGPRWQAVSDENWPMFRAPVRYFRTKEAAAAALEAELGPYGWWGAPDKQP